jgi:1-phosphofructokinase family hexose kinase
VIVCLAANPSVDRLFEVDRLVKGDIHRPSSFVQVPGGKGLNVARAAAALGADVCAVAILRGHSGRWLQEALGAEGVAGEFVWSHGENRSSLSVADRESATLTEFYEHGEVAPSAAWVELSHAAITRSVTGGWLTISGSMPRGAPDDGYRDLIEEARAGGVHVALDSEGTRLAAAISAGPEVVKLNVHEAGELLGVPTARRDDSLAAASKIRDLAGGDGHAGIVTRGANGVMLAAPDGSLYEGVLYVRGRYPVGSGDAFLAGLVTALDEGPSYEDALRLALGAGAANAEMPGAARLDPSRARELAEGADIRLL